MAPAKINLFLHVVGKLDNGYHELQTVFQLIDWYDELHFEATGDGRIQRFTDSPYDVAESDDLTFRAAHALRNRYAGPEGVEIRVKKNIPVASGLGGGSSDAAATLTALNDLWNLNLSIDELASVGSKIGADVPVFVHGKNAWGEGVGDQIREISIPRRRYVIVVPTVHVSTRRVFRESAITSFRRKNFEREFLHAETANDLEDAACRIYPEVEVTLRWLREFGDARMSGSGGAVFLSVKSESHGREILAEIPSGCRGRICSGFGE